MKQIKKLFISTFILLLIGLPLSSIAHASPNNELDIEAYPNTYLFKISNMKPGDWANRTLTIQNRGERDFTYISKVAFVGGSEMLYEAFLLEVYDSNDKQLFDGKLHEFDGFEPRFLASTYEEDLRFKVTFPYELGNEYQGLATEVEFQFYIEDENPPGGSPPGDDNPQQPMDGDDLASPPTDGEVLPTTATNLYNYLLIGFLFIAGGVGMVLYQKRNKIDKPQS